MKNVSKSDFYPDDIFLPGKNISYPKNTNLCFFALKVDLNNFMHGKIFFVGVTVLNYLVIYLEIAAGVLYYSGFTEQNSAVQLPGKCKF